MRVGILDVGSSTARLLVADVRAGRIEPVASEREYLGLGAEIAESGSLRGKTLARTAVVCSWFAEEARELDVDRAQVIVTAPGRQDRAAGTLVATIREATRLPVRVLVPEAEARLAFDGALALLDDPAPRIAVVDVCGGSTELAVGCPRAGVDWVSSVDLGSLRLTRRALTGDPPSKRAIADARAATAAAFREICPPKPDLALATGGSARAVARLVGRIFDADGAEAAVVMLSGRRSAKVARDAGIDLDRAPTVLAGALLLAEASRALGRPLKLATGGLREGAVLALAREAHALAA